jgi:FKBP-type peptidyl-prolyl cis-trans isomerase FkpA
LWLSVRGAALAAVLVSSPHAAGLQSFNVIPAENPHTTQSRYLEWNAQRQGWSQSPSGLEFHRIGEAHPDAQRPGPDSIVSVDCDGRFIDGRTFFVTQRGKPLTGPLPKMIKGWQEGVQMMRAGETWEFVLPSELAYGEKGWRSPSPDIPSIPPGTALLFRIELEAVQPPAKK